MSVFLAVRRVNSRAATSKVASRDEQPSSLTCTSLCNYYCAKIMDSSSTRYDQQRSTAGLCKRRIYLSIISTRMSNSTRIFTSTRPQGTIVPDEPLGSGGVVCNRMRAAGARAGWAARDFFLFLFRGILLSRSKAFLFHANRSKINMT